MTAPGLIETLRRKAAAEIDAVWQQAHADADAHRAERQRGIDEARAAAAQQTAGFSRDAADRAATDAERRARAIRTAAKTALADRFHQLTTSMLPQLRDDDHQALFEALAAELPRGSWTRVIVGAGDEAQARRLFPGTEVVIDRSVIGGMTVERPGVQVSNTLDTRLEAAWTELLAGMMSDAIAAATD